MQVTLNGDYALEVNGLPRFQRPGQQSAVSRQTVTGVTAFALSIGGGIGQ